MTTKITLRNREDCANCITSIMGFVPSESMVFIGLNPSGAPLVARVDIDLTGDAMRGIAQAFQSNAIDSFILVVYTQDDTIGPKIAHLVYDTDAIPAFDLIDAFRINGRQMLDLETGEGVGMIEPQVLIPGAEVRASREALVADAGHTLDAHVAMQEAVRAYRAGDGARAWIFSDRAEVLGLDDHAPDSMHPHHAVSDAMMHETITTFLAGAVNPHTLSDDVCSYLDCFLGA